MVRFSLSPKITLRKEKTRKNSENKESTIRLKRRIDSSLLKVPELDKYIEHNKLSKNGKKIDKIK